jgi:hypothetical protein
MKLQEFWITHRSMAATAAMLLWVVASQAQPNDSLRAQYIQSYPEHFHVQGVLLSRNLRTELRHSDTRTRINFRPNGRQHIGAGVYLWGVLLQGAVRINKQAVDEEKFGRTESFDFLVNTYARKWGADVAVQNYQGFYISDPRDWLPDWDRSMPRPQREDLVIQHVMANVFYVFNHQQFSYRAAYNMFDRQRKSAGSWMLSMNFSTTHMRADSSLIPAEIRLDFSSSPDFSGVQMTTLSLLPGYSYTFIHRYWFVNFSLAVGPGHQWLNYWEGDDQEYDIRIRPMSVARASMGYHSDRWFAAITFFNQSNIANPGNILLRHATTNFRLVVGVRFAERGFLRKHPDRKKIIGF